jgi:hypothetical protein
MIHNAPIGKSTRTTWRANVREIAKALGIPITPSQWITIESAEDDGDSPPLTGHVDIVLWEHHQVASGAALEDRK